MDYSDWNPPQWDIDREEVGNVHEKTGYRRLKMGISSSLVRSLLRKPVHTAQSAVSAVVGWLVWRPCVIS